MALRWRNVVALEPAQGTILQVTRSGWQRLDFHRRRLGWGLYLTKRRIKHKLLSDLWRIALRSISLWYSWNDSSAGRRLLCIRTTRRGPICQPPQVRVGDDSTARHVVSLDAIFDTGLDGQILVAALASPHISS